MTTRFKSCGLDTKLYDDYKSVFIGVENITIGNNTRIDGIVKFEGGLGLYIGDYVHIASFVHLNTGGGELHIGSHTGIASHTVIITGQPDFDFLHICPNEPHTEYIKPIRKVTNIGKYVMIGVQCCILSGVTIGDGAIIGAKSLVTKDIPPFQVWFGSPAVYRGERIDYYPDFKIIQDSLTQ